MKLKLDNPELFSKSIDLISELVLEVRIKLNEFGLSIVAIDPANVAMVSLKIPKSAFTEFEVEKEVLGVNLENLKKILKRAGKKSSLIFQKSENTLNIQIEDKIRRIFSLNLIDVDSEDKEFPSHLEYSSKVEIESNDFIDSIEDCSIVSDSCTFKIFESKFIVESRATNSARSEFPNEISKINGEDCTARYSLDYLQKFLKAGKNFKTTFLNFGEDHPLRTDFNSEHLSLSFLLAPRVETQD